MAKPGNPNCVYRDARHPRARFDDASIRRIRRRYYKGWPLREIAATLGVHHDTLRRIVARETYAGVV